MRFVHSRLPAFVLLAALASSQEPCAQTGLGRVLPNVLRRASSPAAQAPSTADIRLLRLRPDEGKLVYSADAETDELPELYAVKPTGGAPVKLSLPFDAGRSGVLDFLISPDGRRVLYLADHAALQRFELYSVPIDGGMVVKLDRPRSSGQIERGAYRFTRDNQHVVFLDVETAPHRDLFVASLADGGIVKLSRSQGFVVTQALRLSPDGQRVVYQSTTSAPSTFRIFSTRLDGTVEPRELARGPGSFGPQPCEISPDSTRVLYGGWGSVPNLFSVPISGRGAPVQLNGALPAGGGRVNITWHISADGRRVVYESNEEDLDRDQIYTAPLEGSAPPVRVSDNVRDGQTAFPILSSTGRAVFVTNPTTSRFELQSTPISGGATPDVLSMPSDELGLVFGVLVRLTPDDKRALYLAEDPSGQISLFSTNLDGTTTPSSLASLALGSGINIYYFGSVDGREADLDVDPVSKRVVFVEVSEEAATSRLFSVPLDGGSPAVEVSGPIATGSERAMLFVMASRTGRIYYTADALEPGVFELYSAPIDGSRPPVRLVDF